MSLAAETELETGILTSPSDITIFAKVLKSSLSVASHFGFEFWSGSVAWLNIMDRFQLVRSIQG